MTAGETDVSGTGLSPRIERLRNDVTRRKGSWVEKHNPFAADVALWRAVRPGRSVVQTRAAMMLEYVSLSPTAILPDWHLAGEHLIPGTGHPVFGCLNAELNDERYRISEFGLSPDEAAQVALTVERWRSRYSLGIDAGDPFMEDYATMRNFYTGHPVVEARGWMENHSIRDYAKVLRHGFRGIKQEVEAELQKAVISDADFPVQENFWRAALFVCEAGMLLGRRYAALASDRARDCSNPEECSRLQRMATTCSRVPEHGAATLFEAVQSLWLAHLLTAAEDGINANSIGRLDQLLYPYYKADVEAGRTTPAEAMELMQELACKLYLEYDVQAITLGGVDADGNDAVNDMSRIILEATKRLGLIRDLSVRIHRDTPMPFLVDCAELVSRGGGIPFFFNDEAIITALSDRGIPVRDARDYAPIGCVEITIPGKANPHAVSAWFNAAKCLELALHDGFDHLRGVQTGPHTGHLREFSSFAELFAAYKAQIEHHAAAMVYVTNRGELEQKRWGPLPCWSVLTDDCIKRGLDITAGGALYFYHSICFLGTANVADSLMAMKHTVFEEGSVSPEELCAALQCDFEDYEPLRRKLLRLPKYGNDEDVVDFIARDVNSHFIETLDRFRSPLGGRYFAQLFTFLRNIYFGKLTGATPDGRRAGEPLAYSLSAQQGRDSSGVTAMLNSLSKLPHDQAAASTAAIIELDPAAVAGSAGIERLAQLVRTSFDKGIGQLQWNITTAERLLKAQEDPERFGNIPVRVAGYSQLFNLIDKDLQDHIIARTKHKS